MQVLASIIPNCFLQAFDLAVPSKATKSLNYKIHKSHVLRKAELQCDHLELIFSLAYCSVHVASPELRQVVKLRLYMNILIFGF